MGHAVTYVMLLALAAILSAAVIRPLLSRRIPDIPVYLAVEMACGASGLSNLLALPAPGANATTILKSVQFVSLYLLIFSSCAGLCFSRLREQFTVVLSLVFGSLFAFLIALASVRYLNALAPDPDLVDLSLGAHLAHLLILSLGVMVCSLPFLTKIFINTGLQHSQFAGNVLLSACLVDIIVWAIFPVAIGLRNGGDADFGSVSLEVLSSTCLFLCGGGLASGRM